MRIFVRVSVKHAVVPVKVRVNKVHPHKQIVIREDV